MLKSFFFSGISPFWQISQISAIFVLLFFVQKWRLNEKELLKLFVQWHVPLKYLIEAYLGPNSSQVIGSTRDIIFLKDFSLNPSVLSLLRLKQHNSANIF